MVRGPLAPSEAWFAHLPDHTPAPSPSTSPGVILKNVLSPITMMDVPIHNQDPRKGTAPQYSRTFTPWEKAGYRPLGSAGTFGAKEQDLVSLEKALSIWLLGPIV